MDAKAIKYQQCRKTMEQPVEMGCCSRKGKTGCDGCVCDMSFKDWKQEHEKEEARTQVHYSETAPTPIPSDGHLKQQ